MGLRGKLCITLLVATIPGLMALGTYAYLSSEDLVRERMLARLSDHAFRQSTLLRHPLQQGADDLHLLAQRGAVRALAGAVLAADGEATDDALGPAGRELLAVAELRGAPYRRIGYVADEDQEVIAFEWTDGLHSPALPADGALEGPRGAFLAEAMQSQPGEVHVSSVRLDRDGGEIVRPLRPTVRYAARVADEDDRPAGLVFLDLDIGHHLGRLVPPRLGAEVRVADSQGWYLVHPDPDALWGSPRDLGGGFHLTQD